MTDLLWKYPQQNNIQTRWFASSDIVYIAVLIADPCTIKHLR